MVQISQLQENQVFVRKLKVKRWRVWLYMLVSMDFNRIHWSRKFARSKGLDGCVVQGGLIGALLTGQIVSATGNGTVGTSVGLKFRGFVPVGATITLRVEVKKLHPKYGFANLNCLCFLEGNEEEPVEKGEVLVTFLPNKEFATNGS